MAQKYVNNFSSTHAYALKNNATTVLLIHAHNYLLVWKDCSNTHTRIHSTRTAPLFIHAYNLGTRTAQLLIYAYNHSTSTVQSGIQELFKYSYVHTIIVQELLHYS